MHLFCKAEAQIKKSKTANCRSLIGINDSKERILEKNSLGLTCRTLLQRWGLLRSILKSHCPGKFSELTASELVPSTATTCPIQIADLFQASLLVTL